VTFNHLKAEIAVLGFAVLVALLAIGWVLAGPSPVRDADLGPDPFGPGTPVGPEPRVQDVDLAGAKILEGADRAFKAGFFETAAKFYVDFDLRYAGTKVYDDKAPRVWEQLRLCYASMGQSGEAVDRPLKARKDLHARWQALRDDPQAAPAALKAFLADLPAGDGRRPLVEARLSR